MISALANIWGSFLAGIFAPLGAVCVLPLYPGFLAYLASQLKDKATSKKSTIIVLGLVVMLGVVTSMMLVGLIFTLFFQASLTKAIGIISPIAFTLLAIISILLIFNVNIGSLLPKVQAPITKSPYRSSFIFGFFFGGIALPCNPASLVVLFALSTTAADIITNFLGFLAFGIGMGLPLLILAIVSAQGGQKVVGFLTKYTRAINLVAGLIMLGISFYYLFVVFKVHELVL